MCAVQEWGWGGGMGLRGWRGVICGFVHEVKLARNLMFQTDPRSRIPVCIPVPHWDGESSSKDHT